MAEKQELQPQSAALAGELPKWTCSHGPWGQKCPQFSCVLGPSPNELWPLPALREVSSIILRPEPECMLRSAKWHLPYQLEAKRMRKGIGAGCTSFADSWNKALALIFPQLKMLLVLNLFFCDLFGKKLIHLCISLNGRLYIILFYQMRIGAK